MQRLVAPSNGKTYVFTFFSRDEPCDYINITIVILVSNSYYSSGS
jgi:hypothetical protein